MSVVSERMSFQSCSVSPSCNCLFIVYSITDMWCVFVQTLWRFLCIYVHVNLSYFHVNFSGTEKHILAPILFSIYLIEAGVINTRVV